MRFERIVQLRFGRTVIWIQPLQTARGRKLHDAAFGGLLMPMLMSLRAHGVFDSGEAACASHPRGDLLETNYLCENDRLLNQLPLTDHRWL